MRFEQMTTMRKSFPFPLRCLCMVSAVLLLGPVSAAFSQEATPKTKPAPKVLPAPEDLNVRKDLVYKTIDGLELKYDLIRPMQKPEGPEPLVLYIHGGGWRGGNKETLYHDRYLPVVRALSEAGAKWAAIEYRRTVPDEITVVDSLGDCKDALRYFVSHAEELGIDPSRITLMGGSAGGHLVLMTATAPDEDYSMVLPKPSAMPPVAGVVAYYPLTHFGQPEIMEGTSYGKEGRFDPMLGGPFAEKADLAKRLSPIEWLTAQAPPTLILHGDADDILPVKSPRLYVEKAKELGAPVTYLEVKGGNHGFSTPCDPSLPEISETVTAFLKSVLFPGN